MILHPNWHRDIMLLLCLVCANSIPLAATLFLKERLAMPVDLGLSFLDGQPLFGPHKTWRGLILSIFGTTAVCSLFYFPGAWLGAKIAVFSMVGDLLSSFIKRRLRFGSGNSVIGLDQGLESFLPLWCIKREIGLEWGEIAIIVLVFLILELIISPVLYRFHMRSDPF
ncbi:MAG: CDP-archaeol synthase [Dissulfurimicrobium hydrothermale]|uniref:CDP-archaeol synthase n=1 Tax=Dissulfurimicrobium hydrothermale TaxID=1750598 RepID=UPI003C754476